MSVISLKLEKICTRWRKSWYILFTFEFSQKFDAMIFLWILKNLWGVIYFEACRLKHYNVDRISDHLIVQISDLIAAYHAFKEFHRGHIFNFCILFLTAKRCFTAFPDVIRKHSEFWRWFAADFPDTTTYTKYLQTIFSESSCFIKYHHFNTPSDIDFSWRYAEYLTFLKSKERIGCPNGHSCW